MNKKTIALLLALMMLLAVLTGCGGNEDTPAQAETDTAPSASGDSDSDAADEIASQDKGTIRVGVAGDFYPFCFMEDDEIQGFEIDTWTEIASRAGYEVEFTVSDFTGLLGMLDSGKLDVVAHSVAVNEDRQEKYAFSIPYVYSNYNLVTQKGSELTTLEDFEGKRVGVVMGGEGERKLIELADSLGMDIDVAGYEGTAAMDEDVRMGRLDARLGPAIQTSATIAKNDLDLVVTDVTVFSETAAYPFPKDDAHTAMIEDVNAALRSMQEDGTLSGLSMNWFNLDATRQ